VEHQVIRTLSRTDVRHEISTNSDEVARGKRAGGIRKLVLICRSRMLRECMEHMLIARAEDFDVESVSDVLHATEQHPDLVLVLQDVLVGSSKLPVAQECFTEIQGRFANVPVVAVAHQESISLAMDAIRCGLRGYILTSATSDTVVAAIRLVLAGGTFLPSELLGLTSVAVQNPEPVHERLSGDKTGLTEREVEIMRKLRQGHPNKVIAFQLQISANTVKAHMRNIMRKLHATNRTQLAFRATDSVVERPAVTCSN
jgi:DNA-binding NarL/FixJ family response regulator